MTVNCLDCFNLDYSWKDRPNIPHCIEVCARTGVCSTATEEEPTDGGDSTTVGVKWPACEELVQRHGAVEDVLQRGCGSLTKLANRWVDLREQLHRMFLIYKTFDSNECHKPSQQPLPVRVHLSIAQSFPKINMKFIQHQHNYTQVTNLSCHFWWGTIYLLRTHKYWMAWPVHYNETRYLFNKKTNTLYLLMKTDCNIVWLKFSFSALKKIIIDFENKEHLLQSMMGFLKLFWFGPWQVKRSDSTLDFLCINKR